MKMKTSIIVTTIAVLLLLVGISYWKLTGRTVTSGAYDDFARCLTDKGVIMYGAYWCPHCQNQEKMFDDSWQYVNYVECDPRGKDAKPELCYQNNIQGYPTWKINGKFYPGEKTLQELSSLSGCPLS